MKTSKLRKPGLVLLVIGVVLLWFSGKDFLTSLKAPVDLNEAGFTADQVEEGMHVKTDIYAALDTFASEETWTENKDGSSTPKETAHQYYIIPVGEMEYMALEIGSSGSQFSTMSAIMDETYAYLTDAAADLGTTILPVEGTVEKLEGELDQYFGEWFTDTMFFGEEDPSPYLVHYMISPRDFFAVRVMAVAGMAAAALGILLLVLSFRRPRQAPQPVETLDVSPTGTSSARPSFSDDLGDPFAGANERDRDDFN